MLSRKDVQGKVVYLADIFGQLNVLNSELQGKNKTLLHVKKNIYMDQCSKYKRTKKYFGGGNSAVYR